MELTVASFFSGIGLLDLGLEWAGWRTVSFSEIDPYANRVLAVRFPDVPNLGDIHGITEVPEATLWAGGFPCQPISNAGKRLGTDDARWLWPAWARLIRQFRPPYLLLENVAALLGRGLGDVLGDLAACGYDAEWDCIPAAAVGAPHRRDRIWIVAYAVERADFGGFPQSSLGPLAGSDGRTDGSGLPDAHGIEYEGRTSADGRSTSPNLLAHAEGNGLPFSGAGYSRRDADSTSGEFLRPEPVRSRADERAGHLADPEGFSGQLRAAERERPGRLASGGVALADTERLRPPEPWVFRQPFHPASGSNREADWSLDGRWWATEPGLGRVADGVPHRVDRLRSLGNAVVPHVPYWIGKRLREVIES